MTEHQPHWNTAQGRRERVALRSARGKLLRTAGKWLEISTLYSLKSWKRGKWRPTGRGGVDATSGRQPLNTKIPVDGERADVFAVASTAALRLR